MYTLLTHMLLFVLVVLSCEAFNLFCWWCMLHWQGVERIRLSVLCVGCVKIWILWNRFSALSSKSTLIELSLRWLMLDGLGKNGKNRAGIIQKEDGTRFTALKLGSCPTLNSTSKIVFSITFQDFSFFKTHLSILF